ncbi:MAG: succinate dehydrogenase, cytochrome b556 subunit [Alphaproteobacteria bacterium HGW-Alphaproteobacteria-12]|nr:MAG: succinate dehydrogenase, cytochrome b556 subunit [Alphaproteobacteria bacterium HGW-Alphaproteobacteria-12]
MAEHQQAASRPLSPHLMIYRVTITMAMSIIHRITGAALYFGTGLLAWWLIATASGPEAYAVFHNVAGSWIGQLVLFGYTWALLHHLFGGLRYLLWDAIVAFEIRSANIVSWAAAILALFGTVAVWAGAFAMRGAF